MKYVKILGLFALAAAALMAFAGSASATTLTAPEGTTYTSTIEATSEGHVILENSSIGLKVECNSTVEGKVESHGTTVTAVGNISTLDFTNCTNGYVVTVLKKGSLEVHTDGETVTGNGTLTGSGQEVTIHTPLGFSCTYATSGTDLGTVTGYTNVSPTSEHATLDINSVTIPRTNDSALCGSGAFWKGSYKVNTPTKLWVD
ncbi:MAG: hypothetical protein ACTHN3_02895 [Solirubrobacterales bacterium]